MGPRRLIDFLNAAAAFHHRLSELYKAQSTVAEKEDVKLLLQYMSRHEKALEDLIHVYEDDASKAVLESWFKVAPAAARFPDPEELDFRPDLSLDEVMDRARRLDDSLIAMYESLERSAPSEAIKDTLHDLLQEERRSEVRMLRSRLMD